MKFVCVAFVLLLLRGGPLSAQTVAEPLVADVHASSYRASINVSFNFSGRRFDAHNATIVNLIDFAHGKEDDDGREDTSIVGGPTWLDLDRFDVVGMLPAGKVPATLRGDGRRLVERVLAERFHLRYHLADQLLPGFIATAARGGPKLAAAKQPNEPAECHTVVPPADQGDTVITCTSETVGQFLQSFAADFPHPIVDRTGLDRPYDFTFRLATQQLHVRGDLIHALVEAFARQLGVVIAPGSTPQPAIVIDAVERPSANPPETARLIAQLPDLAFEVASIKPADASERRSRVEPGGSQIVFGNFSVQELLVQAWQLPTGAMLGNAPPWLDHTRYTVRVKLPDGIDARAVYQDEDELDGMLQKLLIERFRMKVHWGEQEQEGWVLTGGTPKMKPADPKSRSYCKYGPPEGEKDLRGGGSPYNVEFHCQNVTMGQFAQLLQALARSEIKNRVDDRTGIAGSYDFKAYYTKGSKLRIDIAAAQAAAKGAADASSSDTMVGFDIQEAFRRELGLKLEKRRRTYPALMLDHMEQVPTEN